MSDSTRYPGPPALADAKSRVPMHPNVARPFADRDPAVEVAQAYERASAAGRRLPPGDLVDILDLERRKRTVLLDLAAEYGPVFKAIMNRRLVVCVVGDALGRRVLKEHAKSLRPLSIEIESLVPKGFMRGMEGETHRRYRRALVQAIACLDGRSLDAQFEAIAERALAAHAASSAEADTPTAWIDTLGTIAASCLIVMLYGVDAESDVHARLLAAYKALGPHGVVWNITERQAAAFRALSDEIGALAPNAGGLLRAVWAAGAADATMLGNLIYMLELGRYDLRGLLRWLSRYAADTPDWLDRIARESTAPARDATVAEAFVLETLRMDQSERLMRDVTEDLVVEDWLIPAGALLRVCMWEAHKDAAEFAQPFVFDPSRFLQRATATERFSPFGLDHHRCPLAESSIRIASAFLRALAKNYEVVGRNPEPATRGPYHWEPSSKFVVALQPRGAKRTGSPA